MSTPEIINVQFEPLTVQCRHSRSHFKCFQRLSQWLVCWPDPYSTSYFPVVWAIYGMSIMLFDMGTDLWVARTHYYEGHFIWSYLTVVFFILPMVFALGYTVLLRRYQSWYQCH